MQYPTSVEENKRYRAHVLMTAKDNPVLQEILREKSRRDILFFVNTFCWTYNPRVTPTIIPFVTYPFQDDTLLSLVSAIENGTEVAIEKSRDMGASWMMVVLQVWGLLNGYSSLYGSYKEDYVDSKGDMDSHFERIRYVLEKLPKWFMPSDISQTYMNISSKTLGGDISGDSGQNFGTGGRRRFVIMDEFALWQFDKKAFRKTKDITNCRIFLGTPEGKFNVYGQVMTNGEDYKHLSIERIRLHWTLHPLKDEAWYEEEKKKRTKLDVAKELDISYEESVTGAVYPEFQERVTIKSVPYDPLLPLYTSWDFGRDMNAIIWWQKDFHTNRLKIIDCYQKKNVPIEFMVSFIYGKPVVDSATGQHFVYDHKEQELMKRHKPWESSYVRHYGDPYNADAIQTNTRSSIRMILRGHGVEITTNTDTSLENRIRKTHLALPRIDIDEACIDVIQAMIQSRYPDDTKGMTREKTKPIHDFYSHLRTCFEYFIDNEPLETSQINKPLTYGISNQKIQVTTSEIEEAIQSLNSGYGKRNIG